MSYEVKLEKNAAESQSQSPTIDHYPQQFAAGADNTFRDNLHTLATAFGLMTAIPLVFAHVMFKDWISRYELKMKSAGQKLLIMLQDAKTAPSKS